LEKPPYVCGHYLRLLTFFANYARIFGNQKWVESILKSKEIAYGGMCIILYRGLFYAKIANSLFYSVPVSKMTSPVRIEKSFFNN